MSGGVRVSLRRWTTEQRGLDRLYVNGANGRKWGFVNLKNGNPRIEGGMAWPDEIGVAVGRWLRSNGRTEEERKRFATYAQRWPTTLGPLAAVEGTTSSSSSTDGKRRGRRDAAASDLSANRAGAAVMAEARRRTTIWTRIGRLLGMNTDDTRWRVGARGEHLVGRTLWVAQLLGWKSLHAIPLGHGDIDHVLIGRGGVISINTKHYRGAIVRPKKDTILVRGRPQPWAHKARKEAIAVRDRLDRATGWRVEVDPMIVVVGGVLPGFRRRTGAVRVASRRWLLLTLLFRRRRLARATRDALYEAARRPETWR